MGGQFSTPEYPEYMPVHEQFVSESIVPMELGASSVIGEPALPVKFRWRKVEYEVAQVIERWKTTGACRHGSGERYVRRHWYRVLTTDGSEMKIYFERQPRLGQNKKRWWLASVVGSV